MRDLGGEQHEIVIDGRRVFAVPVVKTWHETGLVFPKVTPRGKTDLVVLHWTGAENPPSAVNRNMIAVGYSVHFVIDSFGVVWQMADANALCAHASGVNDRSVGIELINRGDASKKVPTRGVERRTIHERVQGKMLGYAAFTLEQEVACVGLVAALCDAFKLPMRCPTFENGDVKAEALTSKELQSYRGVIGHCHTKKTKSDPGAQLLRVVHLHGQAA